MKRHLKKLLSILLAAAFVLSMLPFSGVLAADESPTLADGSEWLLRTSSGSVTLAASEKDGGYTGEYTATTDGGANWRAMKKEQYPILSTTFNESIWYNPYGYIGFSTEYAIDETAASGSVVFRRSHNDGNYSSSFEIYANGGWQSIGTATGVTRDRYDATSVVYQDGSYYLKYGGTVMNGCDAARLENYFPAEFLANDGMVYFFFGMATDRAATARFKPSSAAGTRGRVFSLESFGDRNGPANASFGALPTGVTYDTASGSYNVTGSVSGFGATLGIPVTTVSTGYGTAPAFTVKANYGSFPSSAQFISINFSNDPTFSTGTVEQVQIAYVGNSDLNNHVQYYNRTSGRWDTIGALPSILFGTPYTYTFLEENGVITGLTIANGSSLTISGFGELAADQPIYMQIAKKTSSEQFTTVFDVIPSSGTAAQTEIAAIEDGIAAIGSVTADNTTAAKSALDALYTSALRWATTYDTQTAASRLVLEYDAAVTQKAAALTAQIDSYDVASLRWQDKDAIAALVADYEAQPEAVKALVTNAAKLAELTAAVEALTFDNTYITSNGDTFYVECDLDKVSLGSASNGALTARPIADADTSATEFGAATTRKTPILLGSYDLSFYFGQIGSARIGFTTNSGADIFHGTDGNTFALYRTESSNTTCLLVVIDGVTVECARFTATRVNLATVGVVEQNGSYYVSYNGKVIDGAGYSQEVQEAVKLENTFDAQFLANNGMVNFFISSESLHDYTNAVYFHPAVSVENGLIADGSDLILGDRNGGMGGITEYNDVATTRTENGDGTTTYTYNVPSAGNGVILASPINPNGFTLDAVMGTVSGNQWVHYSFSNDPTFRDGTEISFDLIQFTDGQCSVFYNGEVGWVTPYNTVRFVNFYKAGFAWKVSFVESDGAYHIRLNGPSAYGVQVDVSAIDFSSLMGKPIYMRIKGGQGITPQVSVTTATTDAPAVLTQDSTYDELTAFYADTTRYSSYEALDAASELYASLVAVPKANVEKTGINASIAKLAQTPEDYFLNRGTVDTLNILYEGFTDREKDFVDKRLAEINSYLGALADTDAAGMARLRKTLLGAETAETSLYDYRYDNALDIRDLVRMKKDAASKK